jgi:hypothetical protein
MPHKPQATPWNPVFPAMSIMNKPQSGLVLEQPQKCPEAKATSGF